MSHQPWTVAVLNRLKFFARPLPLVALSGTAIIIAFVVEYRHHPDWFGAYEEEDVAANGLDASGLTAAEQAAGAEIDNLNLLFRELGIQGKGSPAIQATPEKTETPDRSLLGDLLALSQPEAMEDTSQDTSNFLNQYLDKYQFLGNKSSKPAASGANSSETAGNPSITVGTLLFGGNAANGAVSSTQPPVNVLEQALQAQIAQRRTEPATASGVTESRSPNVTPGTANSTSEATTTLNDDTSSGLTIPGVPFPGLPTTAQMSPPPGTTGYTAPSSTLLVPPVPRASETTNPFVPPSRPNLMPSSAGVPNLPVPSGTAGVSTPQVRGGGYVTPVSPVAPIPTPTMVQPPPPPFSADRPQGNGYINTFSNPSAPAQ